MEIKKAIERVLKNKTRKTTIKEYDVKYVLQQDVEFPNTYLVSLSHVGDEPCFVGVIAKSVEGNYYNFKRMIGNQEVIFKQLFYIDELEEKLFS